MALLLMEGFEAYNSLAELKEDERFSSASTTSITVSSSGRLDGKRLDFTANNRQVVGLLSQESNSTVYAGFAINLVNSPNADTNFFRLRDKNSVTHVSLAFTTTGLVQVYRGTEATGTLLGTSTNACSTSSGIWNYIELKVTINDTTGTVLLKIDGVTELNLSSQDTKNSSLSTVSQVVIENQDTTADHYFDDLYVGDSSGTDLVDLAGDCHIEMLRPDGAGNSTQWTASAGSNWQNVDEDPIDDDTTYNHTSTATNKDLYTVGNIAGSVDTIIAVAAQVAVRKEDAGDRTINTTIRSDTFESDGTARGVPISYQFKHDIFENDPDGGGAWTEAQVNAMQVGIELTS